MTSNFPAPSTIGGIKRLAKQLKRQSKHLSHLAALDMASRQAKFENFKHAHRTLKNQQRILSNLSVYLVAYWYDKNERRAGREVLETSLSKPLSELGTRHLFRRGSYIGRFRQANSDLFVKDELSASQESARTNILAAARTLHFMDATGLIPNKRTLDVYPNQDLNNGIPGADHTSSWWDPNADQCIVIDEPYPNATSTQERTAWAESHSWHLGVPKWEGLYYPGMTKAYVATDASRGYDFDALMVKIEGISKALPDEEWAGNSSDGHDVFLSPLSISTNDKKRAIAKGTIYRFASNKTVPLRSWNDPTNERRPNASMPIEVHQKVARFIKAAQSSNKVSYGTFEKLNSVKSKLEDWLFSEYDKATTDKFELFYYGSLDKADPLLLKAATKGGAISILKEVRALLAEHYVSCEPLNKMLKKLDAAINTASKAK